MNALEICVICVISVRKNIQRGYFHADFADLADFLFGCYYVKCMNALEICVISVISVRKNILRGYFHADFADLADSINVPSPLLEKQDLRN